MGIHASKVRSVRDSKTELHNILLYIQQHNKMTLLTLAKIVLFINKRYNCQLLKVSK